MKAFSSEPWVIFAMINVLLFVLGTFLDMAPTILICTPIFLPIAMQFGMDPLQFGVVMLINCALGLNTPPVGTVQFVGCAIGEVSVGQVMRTIWPFYGALGLCLLLVTYVPAFSLWLPPVDEMTPHPLPPAAEAGVPFVPSARFPDPAVEVLDERFLALRLYSATVEQLATGLRWAEGPVWFGDGRYLLVSDIPNDRILRWDECSGAVSVFASRRTTPTATRATGRGGWSAANTARGASPVPNTTAA